MSSDRIEQRIEPARLRTDRVPRGIFFMLGATVLFAASTALSKWQVASYSFAEVLWFRSATSLLTCALLILPRGLFGGKA